jgi:hypothetical protein
MSPSVTHSDTDPAKYPTVRIGEEDFELRYRHRDIMRLRKQGIKIGEPLAGIELIEQLPAIIHAGLQHLGPMAPSLKKVEDFLGDLDYGDVNIYTLAFIEAQKKASPKSMEAAITLKQITKEAKREMADMEQPAMPPMIN